MIVSGSFLCINQDQGKNLQWFYTPCFIIDEDIFSYSLHFQDILLIFAEKHLNWRTDIPLWLTVYSNALAKYSFPWSLKMLIPPAALATDALHQFGHKQLPGLCNLERIWWKAAAKSHGCGHSKKNRKYFLQTCLPTTAPSPGHLATPAQVLPCGGALL